MSKEIWVFFKYHKLSALLLQGIYKIVELLHSVNPNEFCSQFKYSRCVFVVCK